MRPRLNRSVAFQEWYQRENSPWGNAADRFMVQHLKHVPLGSALDLGCGNGRNALYLAHEGFNVTAVDIASTAVKHLLRRSRDTGLDSRVVALVDDIRNYDIKHNEFTFILSAGSLLFMKKNEALELICQIKKAVAPHGCVYIGGFTTDDKHFGLMAESYGNAIDETYYIPSLNSYQFWFKPGELKQLFDDWSIIDYIEVKLNLPPITGRYGEKRERDFNACMIFAQKIPNNSTIAYPYNKKGEILDESRS